MNGEMLAYFHGNRYPIHWKFLKIIWCFSLNPAVIGALSLSIHVSNWVLCSPLSVLRSHINYPHLKLNFSLAYWLSLVRLLSRIRIQWTWVWRGQLQYEWGWLKVVRIRPHLGVNICGSELQVCSDLDGMAVGEALLKVPTIAPMTRK